MESEEEKDIKEIKESAAYLLDCNYDENTSVAFKEVDGVLMAHIYDCEGASILREYKLTIKAEKEKKHG